MATWLRIFGVLVLMAMTVADPGPSASKGDFPQRMSLWPYNYAMGYPKSVQTLLRIKKDGQKNPQLHADDKKIRAIPRCTYCDNENPQGGDGGYGNQVRGEYQSGKVCNIKSRHMDFVPSKIDLYMNGAERRYNMPCRTRTQRPPDTNYPEYWEEPVYGGSYQQSISVMPSQAPAYGGEVEYAALGGYSEGSAYPNDYGDEPEEYSSGLDDLPEYSETYDEANGSGGADLYMSTPQGLSENYEGDKEAFPGETSGPTSGSNHGMYSDGNKDGDENKVYEDSKDSTSPAEDQSGDTDYSLYSQGYGLTTGSSPSDDSYQLMTPVYSKYFYENTAYEDPEDSKSSTAPETEYTGHSMYSLGYGSTIGTTSEDSDVKGGGANSYQTYSLDESSEENEAKYDPQNDNYLNVFAKLYPKILKNGAPKDYEGEAYTIYSKGYGVVKDSPQEGAIADGKGSEDPVYAHESEKDGSKLEGNGYGNDGSIYSKEYEEETSDKGLDSGKKGEEDSTNNQDAENKESPTASKTEGYDFGYSNSIYSKAYEEDNESSAKGSPYVEKGSEDNSYSKEYEDGKETGANEYSNEYGGKQLNQPSYSEDVNTEEGYSEGTKGEESDSSYSEDYAEEETNGKDYSNGNGDEGDNQYIYTQNVEEKGYSEEDHPSDSKTEGNASNDGNSKYPKVDEDEMENPGEYSTYEEKDGYDYSTYQDLEEDEQSMAEEDGSYSKGYDSENEGTAEDYSSGNGGKEFHQSDYSQDAEAEKGSSEEGYSEDSKTDGNVSNDGQSEYSQGGEGEEESPEEYSTSEESESDDSTPSKDTEEKLNSSEGSITEENDSKNNFYEDSKKKPSSEDTPATTSSDHSDDNDSDKGSGAADKPQSSEDLHGDAAEMEAEPSKSEESNPDATTDATEKTDPSKEHAYTDEKNESEELSKILKGMDIEDFAKACKYLEEYRESLPRSDAASDHTPYKSSEQDGKISIPATNKESQQKETMESPKESNPAKKERQSSSGTTEDLKKKEKEFQHRFTSRARSNESPEDDSSKDTIKQDGDKYSSKKPLNLYNMLVSHFSQQKSHPQYSNFFHLGQSAYPKIYGGGSYANHYTPYNQLPSTSVHPSQYAQYFHKYYPKKDNQPYSQHLNYYAPVHHQNHLGYMPNIKAHPKLFNSNHPQHLAGNYAQFYHNYNTPTSNQHSKPPHSSQYMQGFPVSPYSQPGKQVGQNHYFSSAQKRPVQSYGQLSQTMPNAHRLPLDQSLSPYQFDHSDQYGQQKQYSIPIHHGHPGYPTHETHSNQPPQPIPFHHPHSSKYGTDHPERKPHLGSHIKLTNSNPPSESSHTSMSPSIRPQVNEYAQADYDQNPDHRFIPGSYAQLYDYSHPSHQQAHWSHIQQSPNYILPARPSPPTSAHKPSAKLLQHSYHAESEISSMYTHPTPYSSPEHKFKPSGYVHVKQSEYTVPLHYQNVNSLSKSRYDPKPSMYHSLEHADYNSGSNYYIPRVASSPSNYRSTKYLDPSSRPYVDAGPSKAPWTQNAVPAVPAVPPVPEFSLFNRSPSSSQQARQKPSAGVTRCRNYPFCSPSLDLPNFLVDMEDSF